MSKPTATLETLLRGLIDYAGLFPPASLEMRPAVEEYARQRGGPHAWMLGRFIVPVSQLEGFLASAADLLPQGEGEEPWRLSVLVGEDLAADRHHIDAFQETQAGRAAIEAVELKLADPAATLDVLRTFAGLEVYCELPVEEDPRRFFAALKGTPGRAKIRTGGVRAEMIPSSAVVARFIRAAVEAEVPFKATAGLHHPLRGEYPLTYETESSVGTMFGFLNVFLAAAFARQADLDEANIRELLEERSFDAFVLASDQIHWRGHGLDSEALARARELLATSYGSCSFQEPIDDLRALHLLPADPCDEPCVEPRTPRKES